MALREPSKTPRDHIGGDNSPVDLIPVGDVEPKWWQQWRIEERTEEGSCGLKPLKLATAEYFY